MSILADKRVAMRFWKNVMVDDGCWPWMGHINLGYGRFYIRRKGYQAHRVVYEALVGPIPEDLVTDHLCRNTACVNPGHIEPVTSGENTLRGVGISAQNARKTHCKYGHEFTPENIIWMPRSTGRVVRQCRICTRARHRRSDRKRVEKRRAYKVEYNRRKASDLIDALAIVATEQKAEAKA